MTILFLRMLIAKFKLIYFLLNECISSVFVVIVVCFFLFFVIADLKSKWFVVAILSSVLTYLQVYRIRYIKNNFENIYMVVTVIESV